MKQSFATELLQEVRQQARRWFIAFCVMVGLEVCTIAGFLWYISLPVETEEVSVSNDDGNTNYVGDDLKGDINNGTDNGEKDKTGGKK